MRIRLSPDKITTGDPAAAVAQPAPHVELPPARRGVTSMEYLVMLSFIFLAIILAVQGIGLVTSGLFQNSAAATAKTNEQP
jgi:Flp pilus assembly pilin Flp